MLGVGEEMRTTVELSWKYEGTFAVKEALGQVVWEEWSSLVEGLGDFWKN